MKTVRSAAAFALLLLAASWAGCAQGTPNHRPREGPVAAFESDPAEPTVGEFVQFIDRSLGDVAGWAWDFGDGERSSEARPAHAFLGPGTFQVALTVEDSDGRVDTASRSLNVTDGPGPIPNPGGGFQVDFGFRVAGRNVDFEPRPYPLHAVIDAYHWDFGDGQTSRDSAPNHLYGAGGAFSVTLRASSNGSVAEKTKLVGIGTASPAATPLSERSFAVIAVVDTGINPYHREFRDASLVDSPVDYISGYPSDARRLDLSLDAPGYADAVKADQAAWKSVQTGKLYWIPGTKIVGAISISTDGPTKILDDGHVSNNREYGHGTLAASDAVGTSIGTCPDCLLVVVEGGSDYAAALRWALDQPWIDAVSNSWGFCPPVIPCDVDIGVQPAQFYSPDATKKAVESGKELFFAAGNGMLNGFDVPTLTYYNSLTGPDWVVTVGASDAETGATIAGTGRPVDITSYGLNWKGAAHKSMTIIEEFSGTSAATPIAAGAYGRILGAARTALGDTVEGPHGHAAALGPPAAGMLADGKLTRSEAERALYLTAKYAGSVGNVYPAAIPNSPVAFTYAGYGNVDAKTAQEAVAVVTGAKALPVRSNEDTWAAQDTRVRNSIWGAWSPG